MARLRCVVVTPEATVRDDDFDFVALPLYDGEIGIAPHHGAMIGRLGYGEMRLLRGDAVERFYLDGGFVQVAENVVSVLTNHAIPAADLDPQSVRAELADATQFKAHSPALIAARERKIAQGRAKLRVAARGAASASSPLG